MSILLGARTRLSLPAAWIDPTRPLPELFRDALKTAAAVVEKEQAGLRS